MFKADGGIASIEGGIDRFIVCLRSSIVTTDWATVGQDEFSAPRGADNGGDVRVAADEATPAEDRYGRRLAYVEADGKDLSAELLKAGLAEMYEAEDDIARFDRYRELRAAAPVPLRAQ